MSSKQTPHPSPRQELQPTFNGLLCDVATLTPRAWKVCRCLFCRGVKRDNNVLMVPTATSHGCCGCFSLKMTHSSSFCSANNASCLSYFPPKRGSVVSKGVYSCFFFFKNANREPRNTSLTGSDVSTQRHTCINGHTALFSCSSTTLTGAASFYCCVLLFCPCLLSVWGVYSSRMGQPNPVMSQFLERSSASEVCSAFILKA